jgi:hypothetical protein
MTAMTNQKEMPHEVVDYLALHHVVTVSTSSFTGMPHADTVIYANDARRFFFYVPEGTQMMRNIKDSRHVSVTIDDYTTDWRKVRELQGVGQCVAAGEDEILEAVPLFEAKFGHSLAPPNGTLCRMIPRELHFVDYDYEALQQLKPQVRTFQIEGAPESPTQGAVATSLDQLVFEAGQIIFRPGDRAHEYFVVLEGQVEVRGEGHGVDQTVVRVGPGELFGDQAALRGQAGAITAHAVTRTVALKVDRSAIRDLLLDGDGA